MSEKLAKNISGTLDKKEVMDHSIYSEFKSELPDATSRSKQVWFVTDESGKIHMKGNKMECLVYKDENPGTKVTQAGRLLLTDDDKLTKADQLAKAVSTGQFVYIDTSKDSLMEALIAENDMYSVIRDAFPNDFESSRAITADSLNKFSSEMNQTFPSIKVIIISDDQLNSGAIDDVIEKVSGTTDLDKLRLPDDFKTLHGEESSAFGREMSPKTFYSGGLSVDNKEETV